MNRDNHNWALVLAAGDGTRLAKWTTDDRGRAVPKQFCALAGSPSLLRQTLSRAERVVPRERVAVIVAGAHREWWGPELSDLAEDNVVVQPRNRGTAAGILLPLLSILARDPEARIVMLPSDHFVADEPVLDESIRGALAALEADPRALLLLGITPSEPDSEYGWILPGADGPAGLRHVARFVEKPEREIAERLLGEGGLWNSFVLVAEGRALLGLFERRTPALLAELRAALYSSSVGRALRVAALYEQLETIDFSKALLQGAEAQLRVVAVPPCGWSDLGTPARVEECLTRWPVRAGARSATPAPIDLARAIGRQVARPVETSRRIAGQLTRRLRIPVVPATAIAS